MNVFKFIIEEVVSEEFSIKAESKEEAIKKAIGGYKTGQFMLCPGNLEQCNLSIIEDGQVNNWINIC